MSFSLFSAVIFGIAAAILYKQIRKGYKHGLSRSLIHLATLLCCAVFSAPVSMLLGKLVGKILFGALENAGVLSLAEGSLALLAGAIELLLAMILSALFYLPVFFFLKGFVYRFVQMVCAFAMRKYKKSVKKKEPQYLSEEAPFYVRHEKKIAAGVGVLSGLILVIVLFMPLTGVLKSADDILDTVSEIAQKPEMVQSTEARLLDQYANDPACTVVRASGGKLLYDLTARASHAGHSTYINKEIKIIRSLQIADFTKQIKDAGSLSGDSLQVVQDLLDRMEESLCVKLVLVGFIQEASNSWMQYEPYFGIARPSLGNYRAIDDFFDSVLFVCSTTTIESYDEDLETILNIVGVLEEYPAIFNGKGYETFMRDFVEGDALGRIEAELYKNARMSSLSVAVDSLVMNLIANELSELDYDIEGQPAIYQGIADIMNNARGLEGSVKMTAISNGVAESFAEHGVYLPPAMEERVASILVSNIPSDEMLSEQSVKEYFDAYMQTKDNTDNS